MKSPDFDPELDIQEDPTMATHPVDKSAVDNNAANDAPAAPVLTDLTAMSDLTPAEAHGLLELAALVKARPADFRTALAGKQIVLFFEKPSFRTRLTFESGIYSLGGHAMFVDQLTSRIGEREPVSDMAHNLERWVDALVLRTFSHETVTELARFASIPVINALSDYEHPCQALADFLTLREKFGDLSQVRMAYVGDGNNVAHSLMLGAALFGCHIAVGTPKGYEPSAEVLALARKDCGRNRSGDRDGQRSGGGREGRGRRLYRRLGQHGAGGRNCGAGADLRRLPGDSRTIRQRRTGGGVHALSSGASWRRSGSGGDRFAGFRGI